MRLYNKIMAEFIGTFILVFMGTGAIHISATTKQFGHSGVAIAFGIVVMILIYSFGHISGAHFNPAVSIGFYFNGDMSLKETLTYSIGQIAGAILGSLTLVAVLGDDKNLGNTLPSSTWEQSFVLEFLLTFILMAVIYMSATHGKANKSFAGIAIGATVAIEALVFGPICGASMNPARSIGPAIVTGNYNSLWVYIVATILGTVACTFVYKMFFCDRGMEYPPLEV